MKYWVGVTLAAEHVRYGAAHGFCTFAHGNAKEMAKLSLGDRFVYYASKEIWRNGKGVGKDVHAFIASGTVTGEITPSHDAEFPEFVRGAQYDPPFNVPAKSLVNALSFVTNKQYWGMAFRRSLFEISAEDFKTILDAR